jgi:6-pyruvoyltetrahydropterin/6-carboxytetrahydropterin synthase
MPKDALEGFAAKLIWVDFQPTTENLLLHFARLLNGTIPTGTHLHSLKLYETESSCAELIL